MRGRIALVVVGLLALPGCRQPNPKWLGPAGSMMMETASSSGDDSTSAGEGEGPSSSGDGSTMGSAGGSSSSGSSPDPVACETPAPLGEGECPAVCDACERGRCQRECGAGGCRDRLEPCPPGWPCDVRCIGANSCRDATLWCPEDSECTLWCEGANACRSLEVVCGGGPCQVSCSVGANTCRALTMVCGDADSRVSCERPVQEVSVGHPEGSSCACAQEGCA